VASSSGGVSGMRRPGAGGARGGGTKFATLGRRTPSALEADADATDDDLKSLDLAGGRMPPPPLASTGNASVQTMKQGGLARPDVRSSFHSSNPAPDAPPPPSLAESRRQIAAMATGCVIARVVLLAHSRRVS
jgi:hypothetical protein